MSERPGSGQFKSWTGYYDKRSANPAVRPLLVRTLELIATTDRGPGLAVDLACGEGTDTTELLRSGWRVVAIDASNEGIARTSDRAHSAGLTELLDARQASFEELEELPDADLVYSAVGLPFCPPTHFPRLWQLIRESVSTRKGWIAAQFFGPNDSWATNPDLTFHAREEIEELFAGMDVLHFEERDEDGQAANGPKHWHVFDVIASG